MHPRDILPVVAGLLLLAASGCDTKAPDAAAPASAPVSGSVPAAEGTVTGRLMPARAGASAIVTLEPSDRVAVPITSRAVTMDQSGYEFIPGLLLAQAGQTVQFRNSEDVLHNVRVIEAATETPVFNVATLAFGSYEHRFERPGFYTVTCDIHSTMRADILVTTTPHTALTGSDGAFTIEAVPPGSYTLTLYAGADPVVRPVVVKSGATDLGIIQ